MTIEITVPQLEQKKTTRDYIISVLGSEWPLTARKIYYILKKKYGHSVSYQAVYKVVKDLVSKKILFRNKNGYQINLDWIKRIHDFTEMVRSNYYTKQKLSLLKGVKDAKLEGNFNVLIFDTLFDAEFYLYYFEKNYIKEKNGVICAHYVHDWRPLFYLRAEYKRMKKILKNKQKFYILCRGNGFLDNLFANYYRRFGAKVKTGVSCADLCELMAFDDFTVQVYIPYPIQKKLNDIFEKTKDIKKLNLKSMINDVLDKKTEIQVVINKDKKIARQIKQQTVLQFK